MTDLVDRVIAGWMPGVHLNEAGRTQARRLAERLAQAPITAIYSSPLERALETAAPVAERLGLELQIRADLSEVRFGAWTGCTIQELDAMPLWRQFNSQRSMTRIPGGEMMAEVQARMIATLAELQQRHGPEVIAAVSHGDVIRAALVYYAGMPLDLLQRIEVSPASISVVALEDGGPRLLRLNDTYNGYW
jgi:probable phosphoglycerate mutase